MPRMKLHHAVRAALSACVAGVILAALSVAEPRATTSCENLSALTLPNTTITLAQSVAAGAFTPPPARGGAPGAQGAGRGRGPQFSDLSAFCRVQATLTPSSDSDIRMELWLPSTGWNGKFRGTGNGGL